MDRNAKTVHELLSHGFKTMPVVIVALNLGETKIVLNNIEKNILKQAIEEKDYYEIKNIVRRLHGK